MISAQATVDHDLYQEEEVNTSNRLAKLCNTIIKELPQVIRMDGYIEVLTAGADQVAAAESDLLKKQSLVDCHYNRSLWRYNR